MKGELGVSRDQQKKKKREKNGTLSVAVWTLASGRKASGGSDGATHPPPVSFLCWSVRRASAPCH